MPHARQRDRLLLALVTEEAGQPRLLADLRGVHVEEPVLALAQPYPEGVAHQDVPADAGAVGGEPVPAEEVVVRLSLDRTRRDRVPDGGRGEAIGASRPGLRHLTPERLGDAPVVEAEPARVLRRVQRRVALVALQEGTVPPRDLRGVRLVVPALHRRDVVDGQVHHDDALEHGPSSGVGSAELRIHQREQRLEPRVLVDVVVGESVHGVLGNADAGRQQGRRMAVQDRVAHPEARAPLDAAVNLADEVHHDRGRSRDLRRLVLVDAPAEAAHEGAHVGLVPAAHVEAHQLRREEVDVDVLGAHAGVFGDVVDHLLALVTDGHAGIEQPGCAQSSTWTPRWYGGYQMR